MRPLCFFVLFCLVFATLPAHAAHPLRPWLDQSGSPCASGHCQNTPPAALPPVPAAVSGPEAVTGGTSAARAPASEPRRLERFPRLRRLLLRTRL